MTSYDNKLKPEEVARQLGVSRRTLDRWHSRRVGPARCKVGRTVLYRQAAIEAWLERNETQPVRSFEEAAQ